MSNEWLENIDFSAFEQAILAQKEINPELYERGHQALADLVLVEPLRSHLIISSHEAARVVGLSYSSFSRMIRDGLLLGFKLTNEPPQWPPISNRTHIGVIRRSVEELIEHPWVMDRRAEELRIHEALEPLRKLSEDPKWGLSLKRVELKGYLASPPPWWTPEQEENTRRNLEEINKELGDEEEDPS